VIVEFNKLGKVKHTSLELKPLTVIIGPNNSNKTYLAYSVYGLLDQYYKYRRQEDRRHFRIQRARDGSIRLRIGEGLVNAMWKHTFDSHYYFDSRVDDFFQDSTHAIFKGQESRIRISLQDIRDALGLMQGKLGALTLSIQGDSLLIKRNGADRTPSNSFFNEVLPELGRRLFPKPYVLPAERTALVLVYKLLLARRFKMLRETQRSLFSDVEINQERLELLREQGDIGFPEPVEQFLETLTEIELQSGRNQVGKKPNEFQLLADKIETAIQDSNRTLLSPTKLGQEIRVSVNEELSIDLHNASSSIKQLAPLLLYLRYRADANQLLIIDEPEINLHPYSQVKLLEVFGMLVNLGVNVLITTHSPYLMAHLNNLVNGATDDPATLSRQASSLYLGDSRAFVPLNMVSAYEMKDYKLESLKDEDYGIRWDSLSDVSAEIQQKYFEISDTGRDFAHGK
jgi:energy-coupling factor transporter ATP-binding protein EcfA2